jgi:glycosyltransferase involved in cell wall biosynthesis
MSERGLTPRRINLAVLTHNALDYTKLCVESLCKNTSVPFNLFILDNVSTDDTPKWLAEQTMPNLNYVLSPVNTGVPGGRNKLIEMITPHLPDDGFIIFMDNDIELLPGWAEVYLDFFAEHPEVGIASAWGHQMQVWTTFRTLRPLPKLTGPVDVGCGGFVCWIKAETIKAVGPFDEQLGLFWHEDDDYSVRTLAAGYEVYALPHAPVIHHEHKSGVATDNSIKRDGSPANQAYLVDKWKRNGWVDGAGNIIRPDSSKSGPEWLEVSPSVMLRGASRSNGGYRLIEPCLEIEIKAGALSSPMELRLSLELLSDTLYSGMPLGAALWQGAQKLQEFKLGGGSPERHELRCVLPAYRDSMSLRLEADQYSIPVLNGHSTWDVNRWSFRLSSLSFSSAQAGIPITPVAPSASAVQPEKSRPALHWHAPLLDFSARSWTTRALTDAYGSRAGYSPLASDDIFMEELKKQPAELVRFSRTYGQSQSADTRLFDHPSLAPVKGALPWLASYPGTKRTIAWLDTQGDVLPSDTGRALAGLTEVWTDSSFHAGVLKGAGVPEGKVKIAPPAVDMRLLDPDRVQPIPEYTQGRFNFLCVTDASLEDGWDLLIQAYLSEFTSSDPVNLLIATAGNNITWIHRELLEFLKRSGVDSMRMPTISLVGMRFSQAFAPHMYRSARVLVMPARSGKLSHVLLEAMAMGLPVIATDWGANHDLLSESHAYPLKPAGLVPVPDFAAGRDGNAPGTARWAEPSPMELAQVMRQTYQLQSEAAARGARARAFVLGNYSIQKTADWVAERIGQLTVSDRQTDKVALAQAEVLVASGKQSTSVVVLESAPRVATPGMAEQEVSVSIDARTLLFPETYERGIGQYSLHHLEGCHEGAARVALPSSI